MMSGMLDCGFQIEGREAGKISSLLDSQSSIERSLTRNLKFANRNSYQPED
jgi:hypothetical protein